MKKTAESHLDHGLSDAQVAYIFERFANRDAFFIETFELPEALGTVQCGLYGPLMGDSRVITSVGSMAYVNGQAVTLEHAPRGTRAWASRLIALPTRRTRKVTVIAGPHDGYACILYTAFGGPATPQEPGDPGCKDVEASKTFWSEHALAKT